MHKVQRVRRSARIYHWPIILANSTAMSLCVSSNLVGGITLGMSLSFLASSGFILNDLWDRRIDSANSAQRLEDADGTTCLFASLAGLLLACLGLLVASRVAPRALFIVACIAAGLILYTVFLRKFLIVSNFLCALLGASPLWLPLLLWARHPPAFEWGIVVAMVVMLFSREVVHDIKDRAGDLTGKRVTLPVAFGTKVSRIIAFVLMIIGGTSLLFAIQANGRQLSIVTNVMTYSCCVALLALVLIPAVYLVLSHSLDRAVLRFISFSRCAMTVVPLLLFIEYLGSQGAL